MESKDRPHVEYSKLGKCILNEEMQKIHLFYPMVEVWKVSPWPFHMEKRPITRAQCLELNSMAEHLSRPVTTPHQPCGSYGTGGNQVLSSSDNIINLNAPRLLSLVAQG